MRCWIKHSLQTIFYIKIYTLREINNNVERMSGINAQTITDLVVLAVIVLALDGVFLYTASDFFSRQIMLVQGTALKVNIPGAAACYLLIVLGLYYFVLRHIIVANASSAAASIQTMRLRDGMVTAFLLGVFVYGVYETTTLALLRNWSPITSIIDTTWGGTLFALSAYLFHAYKSMD